MFTESRNVNCKVPPEVPVSKESYRKSANLNNRQLIYPSIEMRKSLRNNTFFSLLIYFPQLPWTPFPFQVIHCLYQNERSAAQFPIAGSIL